jgi:hypothetical protein
MTVVKFPYDASRRVHSRKPRRSKNGTPEERAAKAAAMQRPGAAVVDLRPAAKPDYSYSGFLWAFRTYFEDAFARGLTVDQIFDSLEVCYRSADQAKQRFREREASETYDS